MNVKTGKTVYANSERELAGKLGVHHKNIYDVLHAGRQTTAGCVIARVGESELLAAA